MTDINNGVKVTEPKAPQPSLEERLASYSHQRIDGDIEIDAIERTAPTITVWPSCDDGNPAVTLMLDMLWGEPARFLELTPDQACELARMLVSTAVTIRHEIQQEEQQS